MGIAQRDMGLDQPCRLCGAPMIVRRNRETGEAFLGCTTFPSCNGTRSLTSDASGSRRTPTQRRRRIRLSSGHRQPRDVGDYSELVVARTLGRNLTPMQGCVVQILGGVAAAIALYWFIASGTMTQLIKVFADWYADYVMQTLTATPPPS